MAVADLFRTLGDRLNAAVLGQASLCERLLIALLADGHVLLEGAPGLAKTRAVKTLAGLIDGSFQRLQFTPDLLPADLTGSDIFQPQEGGFRFEPGPLFHNLILADEINRAPAKVQSALLEAMGERQISVGRRTYPLPEVFLVLATQNPIEHEGTYALPEAQLDRFMLFLRLDYPELAVEKEILALVRQEQRAALGAVAGAGPAALLGSREILAARALVLDIHLAPALEDYIVRLVAATRRPESLVPELAGTVRFGASPRAAIALERGAKARAWLDGRDYVSPGDIQVLAADVLRHRLVLSYEAEAGGTTADQVIAALVQKLPVP